MKGPNIDNAYNDSNDPYDTRILQKKDESLDDFKIRRNRQILELIATRKKEREEQTFEELFQLKRKVELVKMKNFEEKKDPTEFDKEILEATQCAKSSHLECQWDYVTELELKKARSLFDVMEDALREISHFDYLINYLKEAKSLNLEKAIELNAQIFCLKEAIIEERNNRSI